MEKKPKTFSFLQTILFAICIAGTIGLAVFATAFSYYFSENNSKLIVADISMKSAGPETGKDVIPASFRASEFLMPKFQWGGCRPLNIDRIKASFTLHCWGLANDPEAFLSFLKKAGDGAPLMPEGIIVVSVKQVEMDRQKVFASMLAAFCHEKLHLDITAKK